MNNKLKSCPFCGSNDVELRDDDTGIVWEHAFQVMCWECGVRTLYTQTQEKAVKMWNRRADNDREN